MTLCDFGPTPTPFDVFKHELHKKYGYILRERICFRENSIEEKEAYAILRWGHKDPIDFARTLRITQYLKS